jgi:hypothetical protein
MSSARAGAAMATSVGCFQGDSGVEFIYGGGGGLLPCSARIRGWCKLYLEDRIRNLLRFHEGDKPSSVGDSSQPDSLVHLIHIA